MKENKSFKFEMETDFNLMEFLESIPIKGELIEPYGEEGRFGFGSYIQSTL